MTRFKHSLAILVLFTGALLVTTLTGPVAAEEAVSFFASAKLTADDADDPAAHDHFGRRVAISGDTLVVGVPLGDAPGLSTGSAYVFERDVGGPGAWGRVAKLTAFDRELLDNFGESVAIAGDTIVVGAIGDDDLGLSSGSAYVFERDSGGPDAWGQVVKLTAMDGAARDRFGTSVTVSADIVVIGNDPPDAGSAYVFQRDFGGPENWGQVAELSDVDAFPVAISGDTLVVGSPEWFLDAGSAYVYERDFGGPDAWGQVAHLRASDGADNDLFGRSVAISGDTVVVGAYFDDDSGSASGSAYVFERNRGGPSVWGEVAKLTAADGAAGDFFGWSVSVAGATVVVGAWLDDDLATDSGSAYVFERDAGGPDAWGQVAKLTALGGAEDDEFGESVAVSGDTVVVGIPRDDKPRERNAGSVHVFQETLVDPLFELTGSCPGELTLTTSGVTPRGAIRLWGGFTDGGSSVPFGPCVGTDLELEDPRSMLRGRAEEDGGRFTVRNIPEVWCGGFLQLLDETSCAVADVVPLP